MTRPPRILPIAGSGPGDPRLSCLIGRLPPGAFRVLSATTPGAAEELLARAEADLLLFAAEGALDALPGPHAPLIRLAELAPMILWVLPEQEDAALKALELGVQDYLVAGRATPDELVRAGRLALARYRHLRTLKSLATTDELTGLFNRRGFLSLAKRNLALARRAGRGALLLYADLDGLKEINDRFGHAAGDQALLLTARALEATFRKSDILGRLAGDEFAALLLEPDSKSGSALLERLDRELAQQHARAALPFPLSLSRGAAFFDPQEPCTLDELLSQADRSMYRERQGLSQKGEAGNH